MGKPVSARLRAYCVVFVYPEGHGRHSDNPGRHCPRHRQDPNDGFRTVCGRDLLDPNLMVIARNVTTKGRCQECFRKNALGPKGGGHKEIFDEKQIDYIVARYVESGWSLTEIAEQMYSQKTTIKRYLLKRKVKLRPKGGSRRRLPEEVFAEIEYLYWDCGMSAAAIANELGLTSSAVLRRMQSAGIPRRDRRNSSRQVHRLPRRYKTRNEADIAA